MRRLATLDAVLALRLSGPASGSVHLACSVTGIRCRKLHVDRTKFSRLTGAAHRRLATELLEFFHRGTPGNLKGRPDRAGRDRVDPYPLCGELLRQRFDVVHGCRL